MAGSEYSVCELANDESNTLYGAQALYSTEYIPQPYDQHIVKNYEERQEAECRWCRSAPSIVIPRATRQRCTRILVPLSRNSPLRLRGRATNFAIQLIMAYRRHGCKNLLVQHLSRLAPFRGNVIPVHLRASTAGTCIIMHVPVKIHSLGMYSYSLRNTP